MQRDVQEFDPFGGRRPPERWTRAIRASNQLQPV